MPIIPNLRTSSDEGSETYKKNDKVKASPQAYVDSPQCILTKWIKKCGGPMEPLGHVPSGLRVGIIGGGPAGVTAAFEAVKAGAKTMLIEARSEVGGRARSVKMGSENVFEEGSMRFPPSEAALYNLAEAFGYCFIKNFPDPGKVPTLISYGGETQMWTPPNPIPLGFERVTKGWFALVEEGCIIRVTTRGGCVIMGREFAPAKQMAKWLKSSDIKIRMQVLERWQHYIDEFKNDTFLEGLKKIFGPSNLTPPGGQGENWTDEDFDRFGKLGIGSGGFGALYNAGFLWVMRLMPNCWETDQATFAKPVDGGDPEPVGIRDLWQSILDWTKKQGEGDGEGEGEARLTSLLNTKATAVSKGETSDGKPIYIVTAETEHGHSIKLKFDELFISVTTKAAKLDLDLARTGDLRIFPDATCEAIETVHMTRTTKLFVTVPREYFNDTKFPRVLLTDGALPQLYCLDYGDKDTVVILVVYAWEDYSERLEVEKDPQRLFTKLRDLASKAVSNSDEYSYWIECLQQASDVRLIHWQDDPTSRGAFTCALPGQDSLCAALYYDFEKKEGPGPYLIGDSASFGGGWIESALETTYNCFSAMLERRGELYHPELAPVRLLSSKTYKY